MNIISKIIIGIFGGLMGKREDDRSKQIEKITLGATDAAIVFRHNGARFIYPAKNAKPPVELIDTLDFLRYALNRQDWLAEWLESQEWEQALTDLATEEAPRLEVIDGGLSKNIEPERGPFAPPPDGEE